MNAFAMTVHIDGRLVQPQDLSLVLTALDTQDGSTVLVESSGVRDPELEEHLPRSEPNVEAEVGLAGNRMAQREDFLAQLFDLVVQCPEGSIFEKVCDLLMLLPSNAAKLQSLSADVMSKKVASLTGLLAEENSFRLRYNLQELSALLLPLHDADTGLMESFVALGGVNLLCTKVAGLQSRLAKLRPQNLTHWSTSIRVCLKLLHTIISPADKEEEAAWAARAAALLAPCDMSATLGCFSNLFQQAAMGRLGDEQPEGEIIPDCGGLTMLSTVLARKSLNVLMMMLRAATDARSAFLDGPKGWPQLREILLNSPSPAVRRELSNSLVQLAQSSPETLLFIHTSALSARSEIQDGEHPESFFDLLCEIYEGGISVTRSAKDVEVHLAAELSWLSAYCAEGRRSEATTREGAEILAGHLKLLTVIVRLASGRKLGVLEEQFSHIFQTLLFPASNLLQNVIADGGSEWTVHAQALPGPLHPCARVPAYQLLVELCTASARGLSEVVRELERLHFYEGNKPTELDYEPDISDRGSSGYVGLKNAGATCYINSVMQQVLMNGSLRNGVLDELAIPEADREASVLHQVQKIAAFLTASKMEAFAPEGFWKACVFLVLVFLFPSSVWTHPPVTTSGITTLGNQSTFKNIMMRVNFSSRLWISSTNNSGQSESQSCLKACFKGRKPCSSSASLDARTPSNAFRRSVRSQSISSAPIPSRKRLTGTFAFRTFTTEPMLTRLFPQLCQG